MSGETSLTLMLSSLAPSLLPGEFVYCTCPDADYGDYAELSPLASFREAEGLSLVLPREQADSAHRSYQGVFRCISLALHSSLESVGLTAAISQRLASRGISANVIAACFHDHILVPAALARDAMAALEFTGED